MRGLAAVGVVVRGDTYHFDVVANESARGVMDVALETGVPVGNGILTLDKESQAAERLDKGAEAVRVAVGSAPELDADRCAGCSVCAWLCPAGAIEIEPASARSRRDAGAGSGQSPEPG